MALGYIQVGVTVGVVCRVAYVHERVQVADTGAVDTYVVAEADVAGRCKSVLNAGGRNKCSIFGRVVAAVALLVVDILPCVFVAATQLDAEGTKGIGILGVSCTDLVGVVVIYAAVSVNGKVTCAGASEEKIL